MANLSFGPFVFFGDIEETIKERPSAVAIVPSRPDGRFRLTCPQFEIEVTEEDPERLMQDLSRRIVSFYSSLKSLPENYVNDVQQAQIQLIERVFLPWLAFELGKNTRYWSLPDDQPPEFSEYLRLTPA